MKLNFKYLEQDTNFAKNFKVRVQVRYVTEDTEQESGHVLVPCTKDKKTCPYFLFCDAACVFRDAQDGHQSITLHVKSLNQQGKKLSFLFTCNNTCLETGAFKTGDLKIQFTKEAPRSWYCFVLWRTIGKF